jgi:hypothetical protein
MTLTFPPRLMKTKAAAHYLGISASKLLTLDIRFKRSGANRLYDREDLDCYADSLPYDDSGNATGDENCDAADQAFGTVLN